MHTLHHLFLLQTSGMGIEQTWQTC